MNCFSCKKDKNQLYPKKSDILDNITHYMCKSCIDAKYEPRWVIVLAGRSSGFDSVRDYILNHRYVGVEITAQELMS